ncbi:hypothetical protein [Noviherbaspirillum denitrificans]|uniref:Uncharacterized protein n=1 Tax=Noviherbaspirillum denitrificans TaxID=1968433 RepID=A0A254TDL4_9BURK|nr:hypothetical protein [Noviherbaspirillum denitrificans]OWW20740.1 hypothetical protein AYR66_15885 [Noviherbaspirillum denitrificans]
MNNALRTAVVLAMAAATAVHAQSRGPAAQYWVDLSTSNFSMPGMPEDGAAAGLLGGLMGGNSFGGSMGMGARGKSMDTELYVRAHPSGVEGTHAIPGGMSMGPSLLLVPNRPQPAERGTTTRDETPDRGDKPKGRILLYWGCGDTIRPGQPKVLDFAKQDYAEFAQFFASHGGASKGVQGRPGHSLWPNERDNKRVPDNASLEGEHAVSGDGVPATLKFNVGAPYDFLPKVQLTTRGAPKDGVQVSWTGMQHAKGYFLHAQGAAEGQGGAQDMIFWSSSEKPDNGWSLMTYQSPAQITKLLQQKVILPPSTVDCKVPKGIFDKAEGAMLNMIAYGNELNVSHPPRPEKAPANWQPDWTARVRIKSTGMTMLGMDESREAQRSGRGSVTANEPEGNAAPPSLQDVVPNPVKLLKGLFGN